jgi:hypothetical protein
MMMRVLVFLFVLAFQGIVAQTSDPLAYEPIDYDAVKRDIFDTESPFHYPELLERFAFADTTLTLEEKRYLYYGFTFDDRYSPYGMNEELNKIREIFAKDSLVIKDHVKVAKLADDVLKQNPFNLKAISFQLTALEVLGHYEKYNLRLDQAWMILDAISSTGDGKTMESAFFVTETSHEYIMLDVLGLRFGGTQSLIHPCDYLEVQENEGGIEGVYFNVSSCMSYLSKMFEED